MQRVVGFDRRPVAAIIVLIVALPAVVAPAAAHKRHQAAAAETLATAARDSPRGAPVGDPTPSGVGPAAAPFVMPPMRTALLEHAHNKLVHFPLAVTVVVALLFVLGRRRPDLDAAGRWLVWLAALGGVAAYFSGRLQEEAFEGEPKEWLIHLHGKWGVATAIVLLVWALLTSWKPARKYVWLWGLVAGALVLVTGFYGGLVAHGE